MEKHESQFWKAALGSGLVDTATLERGWAAIPVEKRTSEALDRRLAREVVQQGVLTLWQARQVLKGRARGLFVNHYVLLDKLGQGGMGTVYLAQDRRDQRLVALKALASDRCDSARSRARFDREVRIGRTLRHENLVRVYDDGEAYGYRYLVMEYVDGPTVGQFQAQLRFVPPALAAQIGHQVALGLEHMHTAGLLHRDIKPNNILLSRSGVAKLSDLGLVFDLKNAEALTRDGAALGTLQYTSPEQARNSRAVDIRSDIYSLGCTLYHMLTGEVPFPNRSLGELVLAHQLLQPAPIEHVIPSCPVELAGVVARMMAKSPTDRFARPAEVAAELERFCGGANLVDWLAPAGEQSRTRPADSTAPTAFPAPWIPPKPNDNRPIVAEWFDSSVPAAAPGATPSFDRDAIAKTDLNDLFPVVEEETDLFFATSEDEHWFTPRQFGAFVRAHAAVVGVAMALVGLLGLVLIKLLL